MTTFYVGLHGPTGSGKTALANKLAKPNYAFSPNFVTTIGTDPLTVAETDLPIVILDTAGNERFRSNVGLELLNVALFTLNSQNDFDNQLAELKTIKAEVDSAAINKPVSILVITQCDNKKLYYFGNQIENAKNELGIEIVYNCSVKNNLNIQPLKDKIFNIARSQQNVVNVANDEPPSQAGFWQRHKIAFYVLSVVTFGLFYLGYQLFKCRDNKPLEPQQISSTRNLSRSAGMPITQFHQNSSSKDVATNQVTPRNTTPMYTKEPTNIGCSPLKRMF